MSAEKNLKALGITLPAVSPPVANYVNAVQTGSLERVKRVVKVLGMVNCTPDFTDPPKVINGASDLFVAVFGEKGRRGRR